MSIIEGVDYNLVGVDYKSHYTQLISDTFDDPTQRQELEPLWHIIDVFIDEQARCNKAIYCDSEQVYSTVEDFLISKGLVDNIPPLYKRLFAARAGFLSQAKFPIFIREQWLVYFEVPIKPCDLSLCELTIEFRNFVEKQKDVLWSVLSDLEPFGFPCVFSDEEEEEDKAQLDTIKSKMQ